jgi:hypothetical protein
MTSRRGRMIIGERPAPDLIECLHCKRRWDASLQKSNQCIVCKTVWDAPPEWDQSVVIRKLWIIESRWRIGPGHGPWQYAMQFPATRSTEEIDELLEQIRAAERLRCVRHKPVMTFEYRVIEKFSEVVRTCVA